MIHFDGDYNARVRQRFAATCLSIQERLLALQSRQQQLSLDLLTILATRERQQAKNRCLYRRLEVASQPQPPISASGG